MYELQGENTTVFTGDLHTYNTHLTWGAHPVKCDNLIIEATYAGRLHPDRKKNEHKLIEKVKDRRRAGREGHHAVLRGRAYPRDHAHPQGPQV